jgi:hypothetical protein
MAKFEKKCARSGRAFTASGPAAKYCGTCTACKQAAKGEPAERKPREITAERRKPVDTGFRGEPPTTDTVYSGTIAKLQEELDVIEGRRRQIEEIIAGLKKLEAA